MATNNSERILSAHHNHGITSKTPIESIEASGSLSFADASLLDKGLTTISVTELMDVNYYNRPRGEAEEALPEEKSPSSTTSRRLKRKRKVKNRSLALLVLLALLAIGILIVIILFGLQVHREQQQKSQNTTTNTNNWQVPPKQKDSSSPFSGSGKWTPLAIPGPVDGGNASSISSNDPDETYRVVNDD